MFERNRPITGPAFMRIKPLIILMRPHQYVKNSFVMIGPIFGHYWTAPAILDAALIFVSFCFVASSVYIFNDLIDIDSDASHPIKKKSKYRASQVSNDFIACFFAFADVDSELLRVIFRGSLCFYKRALLFVS